MAQSIRIFFIFLLLAASVFAVPEIGNASAHNLAIAGGLLGAENACGIAEREASADDPFEVAAISAVAIIPMADNMTSDLSSPKLLWSWSAKYPQTAEFVLPPASEDCPAGTLEIYSPSGKRLENGKLRYEYGNLTAEIALDSDGPNPIELDLNRSHLLEENYAALLANLSVNLTGTVGITYSYTRSWYEKVCTTTEEGTGCGCESRSSIGALDFEKPVESSRQFFVETGPVQEFWLNPPLAKRLAGKENASLVFFARRMPAKISAAEGGNALAWAAPYRFDLLDGMCGEKIVGAMFAPEASNAGIAVGNSSVFPSQLVEKNAAYLPFHFSFGWEETSGRKTLELEFEDWFSNRLNFSREFFVREPEAFAGNGGSGDGRAMELRQGDEQKTPAAYPSQETAGELPDVSPVAALFAIPFALFAIGIIRWLREISLMS